MELSVLVSWGPAASRACPAPAKGMQTEDGAWVEGLRWL